MPATVTQPKTKVKKKFILPLTDEEKDAIDGYNRAFKGLGLDEEIETTLLAEVDEAMFEEFGPRDQEEE